MSSHNAGAPDPTEVIPIFRASKKRKLHQRQRQQHVTESDASEEQAPQSSASPGTGPPGELSATDRNDTIIRDDVSEEPVAASPLLPLRKALARKRFGGIEYSADTSRRDGMSSRHGPDGATSGVSSLLSTGSGIDVRDQNDAETMTLATRFMPSTGMLQKQEDQERFMTAFLDSRLEQQARPASSTPAISSLQESPFPEDNQSHNGPVTRVDPTAIMVHSSSMPAKQPAIAGKLHEIDLGPSARRRNEKATIRAARSAGVDVDVPGCKAGAPVVASLTNNSTSHTSMPAGNHEIPGPPPSAANSGTNQGINQGANSSGPQHTNEDETGSSEDDDTDPYSKKKKKRLPAKVRVNRYGKILAPRRPRRRGPQKTDLDMQREKMVEEMLRVDPSGDMVSQNGLLGPGSGISGNNNNDNTEGDEEFAERFRREFFENVASGSGNRVPPATAAAGGMGKGKNEGKSSGPRIGGSRSLRHQIHLQQQREQELQKQNQKGGSKAR